MTRLAGIGIVPSQQMYTTSFGPVVPTSKLALELQRQGLNITDVVGSGMSDNIDGIAVQFPAGGLSFALYGEVDGRQVQMGTSQSSASSAMVTGVSKAYDAAIAQVSTTPPTGHTFVALVSPAAGKLYAGETYQPNPALEVGYSILSAAGAGIGAYHGYKRHKGSVGWALWWGFMGGLFPVITTALAFAQGINTPQRR